MKILITAGGTREHIDEVRVLTNISTGKLGAQIAQVFFYENVRDEVEKIYYICAKDSRLPVYLKNPNYPMMNPDIEIITVDSTKEVYDIMEKLVPQVDIVIHSMAVSDFGFKLSNIKLKSNDPQAFVDSLRDRIVVNPKIISFVKKWNPRVKLIGFKFEVNKTTEELIDIAYESLIKNNCDFVIANDKSEMKEKNEHIAYIVDKNKRITNCVGKLDISVKLLNIILEKV
jgi:phosphopantothenate-cysteine ligase